MIRRRHLVTLASISCVLACGPKNQASQDPGAGEYKGDYYSEKKPGSGDVANNTPQPKPSAEPRRQGPRVQALRLMAKKPTRPGAEPPPPGTTPSEPAAAPTLVGVFPPVAPVGSTIEIFGSGFGTKPTDNRVAIGGKRQKVISVHEDRLYVQIIAAAEGKVVLSKSRGRAAKVESKAMFSTMAADQSFGKPRTKPTQGLLGSVYALTDARTEVPNFAEIGSPVTYIAVDQIDIADGAFAQGIPLSEGKLVTNFGVHFQGSLNVTTAGEYTLCLQAGDGGQLYLDQNLVVNADGTGDTREVCETLQVEAGEYGIDLLWYQNDGNLGLRFLWAVGGGEKVPVPPENLFPPDVVGLAAQIETQAAGG